MRWFILHDSLAWQGLGGRMMRQSIQISRNAGFSSVYVITFKGLGMAMSLLKKAGFKIFREQADETGADVFGTVITRFMLITFSMAESICPIYLHDALGA